MPLTVSIIGGGPCGLMLGCCLDPKKFTVTVFEQNAAPGRKFLVAGDGGLNLTHSEDPELFIERYTPANFLRPAFKSFNNNDLINWFSSLGIKTYKGSSGRIFPEKKIKPVTVLNAILNKLQDLNVKLLTRQKWMGFDENNALIIEHNGKTMKLKSDITVLCTGGASWPVTGSTGEWTKFLQEKNITVQPFEASNCAFSIEWDEQLLKTIEGKALKNISVLCNDKTNLGEVVLTKFGIEGSGTYPMTPLIRSQLHEHGIAEIKIDLKPSLTREKILEKIYDHKQSGTYTSHVKKQLNLSDVQMNLLKSLVDKTNFTDPQKLAPIIKGLPLQITGTGPVEEAISTTGGISLDEINEYFMLKKMPGFYALGEMLDYDAPTGGYLLQSCFSMGYFVAQNLNKL